MRKRRLSSLIGAVLVAPLLAVVPWQPNEANAKPTPVSGSDRTVELLDGTRPEVADAARLPESELAAVRTEANRQRAAADALPTTGVSVLQATPPVDVTAPFAALGVTWDRGTGAGVVVQYRTQKNGTWGAWTAAEVDLSLGPDPRKVPKATRVGSELITLAGVGKVQGRILGSRAKAPAHATLTVIDPGTSDADTRAGASAPGAAHAAAARPAIISRADWGADESWRTGSPEENSVKGVVIHHTADGNGFAYDQVPAMMRSIYRYATQTLQWDDFPYNYVVDPWGRIWQGRYWDYPEQPVWPAATLSNNDRTMGVSFLGNYDQVGLPAAAKSAMERLIAWKATIHQVDVRGKVVLYNNRTESYQTMPAITGHRDTYQTACPGANVYPLLPSIRQNVAALMGYLPSLTLKRDIDYGMDSEVLGRDADGRLTVSSSDGKGGMSPMRQFAGYGWGPFDVVTIGGDWNNDGVTDVIARNKTSGTLYMYPGTSMQYLWDGTAIGFNWGGMATIVAPGDWNGDGIPDIIATSFSGDMYFYAGNGRGGFAAAGVRIGWGWNDIRSIGAVGDWNGDGKLDLIGVWYDGHGTVYLGDGRGGFYDQNNQTGDWGSYRTLVGVSNAYGDNRNNLLAVGEDGTAWLGARETAGSVRWTQIETSYAGYDVFNG